MATERPPSLQDTFLTHVREQKIPLTVFLANGVKLQGIIASFDSFSIALVRDGFSQLIYKHAISTIMPVAPIKLDGEPAQSPTDRDRRPM
jgi:host factor-I protein